MSDHSHWGDYKDNELICPECQTVLKDEDCIDKPGEYLFHCSDRKCRGHDQYDCPQCGKRVTGDEH